MLFLSHTHEIRLLDLGQTRNQHLSDVLKLQKKAVQINFSDKYTSTKSLFKELRILSLMKLSIYKTVF